ncbi:MAG TPA: hypothetical protein DCR14_13785 [Acidimicrobiaceae bacterium]|mgnify:CR=1 FL=1|nr:hypothetical protein [Acidimicrobiaceae bacterium]
MLLVETQPPPVLADQQPQVPRRRLLAAGAGASGRSDISSLEVTFGADTEASVPQRDEWSR